MMLRNVKLVLVSAVVVGVLGGSLTVHGVFGLLNSEARNPGASVASGTLTFSNRVASGTICTTNSGTSNVNSSCDALFTNATLRYPGDSLTAQVTIANTGSLDASDLSVYMPSCTAAQSPGATAAGVSFSGDPCGTGGFQFSIQETNSSFTPTSCWYPTIGGTCSFAADTLHAFSTNANSVGTALDLGAGPLHGASRYFLVGIKVPATADSTLQGREALFSLTWHMST